MYINVKVKSTSVNFYVQRRSELEANTIVSFDIDWLNSGRSISLDTKIFTAPVQLCQSTTLPTRVKKTRMFLTHRHSSPIERSKYGLSFSSYRGEQSFHGHFVAASLFETEKGR